jgi:hypothetical protein
MIARHPYDSTLAFHVSDERIQRAADERRARSARRHQRQASPLRPVGRLLVRLGIALGGAPEAPAPTRTLSSARPR